MRPDLRIVSRTPLHELWDERGVVSRTELRDLSAPDIAELLRAGRVRFVVADVGGSLEWVPADECYGFWQSEVKEHLADPAADNYLEDFPGGYCYFASEWDSGGGEPIVLLTVHH